MRNASASSFAQAWCRGCLALAPPKGESAEGRDGRILGLLEPLSDDRSIVLVGGQAVSFWTRFLGERSSEVGALAPMASKDFDFEGSALRSPGGGLLAARMRSASVDDHTPNTGIVLFVDALSYHGPSHPIARLRRGRLRG